MLLSGALGAAISNEKRKEMKIFAQFYEFNEKLIHNLKYERAKVSQVAQDYPYVFNAFNGELPIKGEEGEFLANYVSGVGQTDTASQIDYLNERGQTLKKYKQSSEEKYKKYGSLYFKICVMAGILVAVLLA